MSTKITAKQAFDSLNRLNLSPEVKKAFECIIEAITDEKPPARKLEVPRNVDGRYFSIDKGGDISEAKDSQWDFDNDNYNFGNYFLTKEEAITHRKRLRTFNRLWAFARQARAVNTNHDEGFYISEQDGFDAYFSGTPSALVPAFKAPEDAQLVLDSLDIDDLAVLRDVLYK